MQLTIDYSGKDQQNKVLDSLRALLNDYSMKLEGVEIIPGQDVFRISVDGEIIFDLGEESFSEQAVRENMEDYLEEKDG